MWNNIKSLHVVEVKGQILPFNLDPALNAVIIITSVVNGKSRHISASAVCVYVHVAHCVTVTVGVRVREKREREECVYVCACVCVCMCVCVLAWFCYSC